MRSCNYNPQNPRFVLSIFPDRQNVWLKVKISDGLLQGGKTPDKNENKHILLFNKKWRVSTRSDLDKPSAVSHGYVA